MKKASPPAVDLIAVMGIVSVLVMVFIKSPSAKTLRVPGAVDAVLKVAFTAMFFSEAAMAVGGSSVPLKVTVVVLKVNDAEEAIVALRFTVAVSEDWPCAKPTPMKTRASPKIAVIAILCFISFPPGRISSGYCVNCPKHRKIHSNWIKVPEDLPSFPFRSADILAGQHHGAERV
jgi:hypothetical protein